MDQRRRKERTRKSGGTIPRGITQVGPGLWEVRAQVLDRRTGRRLDRKRRVPGRIEEAVKAKHELVEAIRSGELERAENEKLSVTDYAIRWQTTKAREGLAQSTIASRADILVDHVLPLLGSYDIARLRQDDLVAWREWALEKRKANGERYSPITINGWWRVLKTMLRRAFAAPELGPCPADGLPPLREDDATEELWDAADAGDAEDDRALVPEEVVALLNQLRQERPDIWALSFLGFATGMRHCELSSLQWRDVDLERGRLRVRRTHVKGIVEARTKTKKSRRWVSLLPAAVEVLRAHRREQLGRQGHGLRSALVFPSKAGTPLSTASVSSGLQRAAKAAGIRRPVSTKTFRLSWNTRAVVLKIDRALLRANTGHTTDAMTDQYSKPRAADLAEVQRRVVGYLDRAEGRLDSPGAEP